MLDTFRKFIKDNPDTLTALIALIAILISVYSLFIQRLHNQRSFKPYCRYEIINFDNTIKIYLWNKGSGPLIIKKVTFKDNSLNTKSSIKQFIPTNIIALINGHSADNFENHIVMPSEKILLFEANDNSGQDAITQIRDKIKELSVETKYKSIYHSNYTWKDNL
jgi:hypothetical protein